ncbi:MAG: replication-associated recombination protein A [Saprospiraceae bacterium]|nr:replication-associated recombination protein A [Saprospiraceae bacterium]
MKPLAERMRPIKLSEVVGQEHLTSEGKILSNAVSSGYLPSMIFWGPPGVGKTTIAQLLGTELKRKVFHLSAISSGVKEIRETIYQAENEKFFNSPSPILFIDEIHRFNKSQQDSLLAAVEQGKVVLIGATTENPSFEINNALLSRAQVQILKPLDAESLQKILTKIISIDDLFKSKNIFLKETEALFHFSGGDARKLCNIMELIGSSTLKEIVINNDFINQLIQNNIDQYDKGGELHYDLISAFIKSMRGSDPDAALYWLARMMAGGEDPNFITRRMLILAAEDIGLANPNALLIAQAAQQSLSVIGWPEGRIILSEAVIYLCCSPKSNSTYLAIEKAIETARTYNNLPVPLHLRNAPTSLMKNLGYGKDYQYAHHFKDNYVNQEHLPKEILHIKFYEPGKNSNEEKLTEFIQSTKKTRE